MSGHDKEDDDDDNSSSFMFPYIQGLLAFDTPFFGIAPGVVAYGAESHLSTLTAAYTAYNTVASAFGIGASSKTASTTASATADQKLLTAPPTTQQGADANADGMKNTSGASAGTGTTTAYTTTTTTTTDGNQTGGSAWQKWGRVAALAGGTSALAAAAGAAAYMHRDTISAGWTWASSHLEFVGCLARGEELRRRVAGVAALVERRGLGFADFYTVLGSAASTASASASASTTTSATGMSSGSGSVGGGRNTGARRTFAMLPSQASASPAVVASERFFVPAVNDKALDETGAHMSMFLPRENPGYDEMAERAKVLVVGWVEGTGWYREAAEAVAGVDVDMNT